MTIEKLRERLRVCPKSEAEEVGRQLHKLWLTERRRLDIDFETWSRSPGVSKALRNGAEAIDKGLIEIALNKES